MQAIFVICILVDPHINISRPCDISAMFRSDERTATEIVQNVYCKYFSEFL